MIIDQDAFPALTEPIYLDRDATITGSTATPHLS